MNKALKLERKSLELQLEEIQVKRKLNEFDLILLQDKPVEEQVILNDSERPLQLSYASSSKKTAMVISDVYSDGSISIKGKNDSQVCAKKYSIKTLMWIRNGLPGFAKRQRVESNFFKKLAEQYSRKFLKNDTISRTTIEKLCYIVDSGKVDYWFEKYESMKNTRQVTLGV